MYTIAELIKFFNERLWDHPPITELDWREVCLDTITYLNSYRQSPKMLMNLGNSHLIEPQEGGLSQCGDA